MHRHSIALLLLWWLVSSHAKSLTPVRVAFLTDCTMYSNWMSLGMIYSFKMSGQPGKVTRVMCCTEEEKANYPKVLLQQVWRMHHSHHTDPACQLCKPGILHAPLHASMRVLPCAPMRSHASHPYHMCQCAPRPE